MRRSLFAWVRGHRGVLAAVIAVAGTTVVGGVGAAGAAEEVANQTIYTSETNGPCFTIVAAKPACDVGETAEVAINTGETVTWDFDADNGSIGHNAESTDAEPADPAWADYTTPFGAGGKYTRTFNQPGTYQFHCIAHPNMTGTITVTGQPVETPTSSPTTSPTATPTVSATPTTQPSDPNTGQTPPPSGGTVDTVKPRLTAIALAKLKTGARVEFRLSEPATVTLKVRRKGSKKVLKTITVQAPAGKRKLTVRNLKKGRYTLELAARDARGNKSTLSNKSLRLRGA